MHRTQIHRRTSRPGTPPAPAHTPAIAVGISTARPSRTNRKSQRPSPRPSAAPQKPGGRRPPSPARPNSLLQASMSCHTSVSICTSPASRPCMAAAWPFQYNVVALHILKCSRIGPIARAGRNVSAPTMTTVPTSKTLNVMPPTGKLPSLWGARVLAAM